jgi:4-amino-4-deoxy-L-arabinose transferase-like glycosyltransferase
LNGRHSSAPESRKRVVGFWAVVVVLSALHVSTFRITESQQDQLTGTRKANVELGFNLRHQGVFTESRAAGRACSAYRPPAYPAFVALGMLVVPDLERTELREIVGRASHFLRPLYTIQKLLLLLTAYLAMYAVWRTTRNRWLCLLPFPLICHTPLWLIDHRSILNNYTNLFYPTPLATFLITALGLSLLVAFERKRYWQFALSGLLAGALALTRAAFLYYIVLGALVLMAWLWRRRDRRRLLVPRVACGVAVALAVAAVWMARNQVHLGRFFIAERGGYQLNVRVQMLDMDRTTYFASFLYWSNSPFLRQSLLPRLIGPERLAEVDRYLDADSRGSYKRGAMQEWLDHRRRYRDSVIADRVLIRKSVTAIAKRPMAHLLISLPLAHRGICVDRPYWLNWVLFSSLFGVAGAALLRGDTARLAMLSPAVFCFLFNVATTNSLQRYNTLLIPLLCVSTAVAGQRIVAAVATKWRDAARSETGGRLGKS